jgi:hypothetical protein
MEKSLMVNAINDFLLNPNTNDINFNNLQFIKGKTQSTFLI